MNPTIPTDGSASEKAMHAQQMRSIVDFAQRVQATAASSDDLNKVVREADDFFTAFKVSAGLLSKLTLRTPAEILAMEFTDDDKIIGDRLLAESQSLVIAAQGGLGKSRLSLQMAAAVITGRDFIGFPTHGRSKKWLILQTENSPRRLNQDLLKLRDWLNPLEFEAFQAQVVIHTVETAADAFHSLEDTETRFLIERAIADTLPDVVVIDPLNEFAIGDLNKDADMRLTVQALTQLCRKGDPRRAIVVLHHALTGRLGAAKATGWDRGSFGRNSKALYAWTRGQINLAPASKDDNGKLVVACGKCSNGQEFSPFGICMTAGHIYEIDSTFNRQAWETEISGVRSNAPLVTSEEVRELCQTPLTKAELAKMIIEDTACSRATAYRHIIKAAKSGKISLNKATGNYTKK